MSLLLPQLEPNFNAALRDVDAKSRDARIAAARRLGRQDLPDLDAARLALRQLLLDPFPPVRYAALESIASVGGPDEHEAVLPHLSDAAPASRELAIIALSAVEHPNRPAVLRKALHHERPEVRFQALGACAELCPDEAAEDILRLTRDSDIKVRAAAARALSVRAQDFAPVRERLIALLKDPAHTVRWEAALGLAPTAPLSALRPLLIALSDPDRRLETLESIHHYKDATSVAAVQELADSVLKSPIVIAVAGVALWKMGQQQNGICSLRRAIRAFRSDGRHYAVDAIREHRISALAPELARLAKRPRGVDPLLIVQALSALAGGSKDALGALALLAKREDVVGRAAAAELPSDFFG